ncbi:hypothetical protein TVAG_375180 [Trichomonas vaginalis G3]|uniref:Uncharacterized protein n=1 Tax=Trichomonas vaginalis (strain ATCC PRA-98 / G3) TaxID=412133 RepID=A2FGZ6_TRIV3|nr:radial spoke protein 3 family [Trichomonas vaginalis G3]EAX95809.1 hypothetical protein TVAG_375180 [Trichomonas vaginalis G3]KAI5500543.1 radial spoke protein 3 family [Trichomonas vaginalis G3]|eukprot:XP_001308739.1 hypothetical protein [Trichomonas vaginalis G3]
MTTTFTYNAAPKTVTNAQLYRDEDQPRTFWHISVDPRVARGSVYSHHKPQTDQVKPIKYKPKPIPPPKEREEDVHPEEEEVSQINQEPILSEIERPIEDDVATAAETYIERPATPQEVKDEPGIDVETQTNAAELFDFDTEVKPRTIILVQNILDRALREVQEEEELKNLRQHRDNYEVGRNITLANLQKREAATKRTHDESKRREEQRERHYQEKNEKNKDISTRGFAESYAEEIVKKVFDSLTYYDEVEEEVRTQFLPWLSSEVALAITQKDFLLELQESAQSKASEIVKEKQTQTRKERIQKKQEDAKMSYFLLRETLIEDRAAVNIRNALQKAAEREAAKKKEEEPKEDEEHVSESESN